MAERGFTVLEAILAMSILAIALVGVLPSFGTMLDANTLSETRSDAVAAAQLVVEDLRRQDMTELPSTGSSPVFFIELGSREFEGRIHYCPDPTYCTPGSRFLVVEIFFGGRTVYRVETVFTQLQ